MGMILSITFWELCLTEGCLSLGKAIVLQNYWRLPPLLGIESTHWNDAVIWILFHCQPHFVSMFQKRHIGEWHWVSKISDKGQKGMWLHPLLMWLPCSACRKTLHSQKPSLNVNVLFLQWKPYCQKFSYTWSQTVLGCVTTEKLIFAFKEKKVLWIKFYKISNCDPGWHGPGEQAVITWMDKFSAHSSLRRLSG